MTARLIYSMGVTLDGFVNDRSGGLDWVAMDEELHCWYNDRATEMSVFIYGRGMYETMAPYWPMAAIDPDATAVEKDFARIWLAKPKVVFSSTLDSVDWNSRLERGDAVAGIARLKDELNGELEVGGATIAAAAVAAGLVDEYELVVHAAVTGGGTPLFPPLERGLDLRLVETRPFSSGAVLLRYVPR